MPLPRLRAPPLEVAIVVAWIAVLVGLFRAGSPDPVPALARFDLGRLPPGTSERWMGIYADGIKIGTSVAASWDLADGGRAMREHSTLRLNLFGKDQVITTASAAEVDADLKARSFSFLLDGQAGSFRAEGRREKKGFRVTLRAGDAPPSETRLPESPVLASAVVRAMAMDGRARGGLRPGLRFRVPFFDPTTQSDAVAEGEVLARTPEGLFDIRYRMAAAEISATIDAEGEVWRETGLLGMEVRREDKETAIRVGWGEGLAPDLIALSAAPVDRPIEDSRSVRRMVVYVDAPEEVLDLLRAAHPGRFDGKVLEVVTPATSSTVVLPVTDPRFATFLRPEPGVESDHPEVRARAGQVLGDVLDGREAVKRLAGFVFTQVEKVPAVTVPSAVQTLHTMKGDCNEHTALFTALSRASGIPTRVAAGLVYSDRIHERGAFYYHAWPEVWLGDGWVPIDPTFGELPANATHVKLVEGGLDKQLDLVAAIGRVSLSLKEASR